MYTGTRWPFRFVTSRSVFFSPSFRVTCREGATAVNLPRNVTLPHFFFIYFYSFCAVSFRPAALRWLYFVSRFASWGSVFVLSGAGRAAGGGDAQGWGGARRYCCGRRADGGPHRRAQRSQVCVRVCVITLALGPGTVYFLRKYAMKAIRRHLTRRGVAR